MTTNIDNNTISEIVANIHLYESRFYGMVVGHDKETRIMVVEKPDGQRFIHTGIKRSDYEMCLA